MIWALTLLILMALGRDSNRSEEEFKIIVGATSLLELSPESQICSFWDTDLTVFREYPLQANLVDQTNLQTI
jgi:hypothetical protein